MTATHVGPHELRPVGLSEPKPRHGPGAMFRSGPVRLVGRRVLGAIPVLWGVTFFTFVVLNLLPGDAASQLLGSNATPSQVKALNVKLHLNQPFFERYWHWLTAALSGNLGTSLSSSQPVTTILRHSFPITAELVVYCFIVSMVLSVPVAVLAARRPGGIFDRITMVVSMAGLSVAPYVLALLLVLVFAVKLGALPALGWEPLDSSIGGNLRSLTLPALSIGFPLACFYLRLLRADLIEAMQSEDYIVMASSKGITPWRVLTRHGLRNSLFGFVTVVGLNFSTLFGGTVIIEQIFGLPGIGQQLYQAIQNRDAPVLEGIVLVFALVVVAVGVIVDLLYAVLDPRIRHG